MGKLFEREMFFMSSSTRKTTTDQEPSREILVYLIGLLGKRQFKKKGRSEGGGGLSPLTCNFWAIIFC